MYEQLHVKQRSQGSLQCSGSQTNTRWRQYQKMGYQNKFNHNTGEVTLIIPQAYFLVGFCHLTGGS